MRASSAQIQFGLDVLGAGLPRPETEYVFHPTRGWRFDYAWPDAMLAVEIEGGTHKGGRHVRAEGYRRDCEKYNAAIALGWRVLRYTSEMVYAGEAIPQIAELLKVAA